MGFNVRSNGWPTKALIDCTADGVISYGIVQPGQNTNEGVPIVRVNNFKQGRLDVSDVLRVAVSVEDNYKRTRLHGGEVLLTLVGSTGQTAIASSKLAGWNVARAIAVIRPADEIGAKWISICLQSVETKQFLDERANTTVQKTLNLADVKRIPIPLPPEHVRRSIESVFSSLDDKIDLNRRINQTLEAMAQAIFKSWFVDFDPVKAKIAAIEQGEDPLRAAMRAISGKTDAELDQMPREHHHQLAATAALFPDAMEESELEEIPKGWNISKTETLLSRLSAKTRYTKGQVSEYGQIPVFEQGASILLGYHNRDAYYRASSENPIFIFGDHTCVTRLSCQPFDISQNVIPLKGKNRATAWVYYAVKEKQKFQEYRRHWMELISKDVVVAAADICLDFSKKITNIHLQIEANERQMQSLRELRDSLLPKLLSGELRVLDIEHIAEEV